MIHIKHPTKEQLPVLAKLFDAYRVFYRKVSDLQGANAYLGERMEQKDSILFIAEKNGEVVGFTQLYPLFSSTNMRRLWVLNDLFVAPEQRGEGISKSLIRVAQEYCKTSKAQGLSLETEKNNQIGNSLYPKMGFEKDDEHNFYFWKNPTLSSS